MRNKKTEEKRIYILVPKWVDTVRGKRVCMEHGRLMAQCAHVARKMELAQVLPRYDKGCEVHDAVEYEEITTIVLSVRNSRELEFMYKQLYGVPWPVYRFEDTNLEFYGTKARILTAVCTAPMPVSLASKLLGHLELYA
jgi:peptidyl-tRNA hydrolase